MEICEPVHSSVISADDNPLYKLHLSFVEKQWKCPQDEASSIESYRSESGHYFSVIYGLSRLKSIYSITIHCDHNATPGDVEKFVSIVFRHQMVAELRENRMNMLSLQSERFLDVFYDKFSEVTDNKFSGEDEYDLYLPSSKTSSGESTKLPDGYRLGELKDIHIEFLAKVWSQDILGKSTENLTRFVWDIKLNLKRPYIAIYRESEENPVGWMMIYSDGFAGQMHVTAPHRRKGLGKFMAKKMAKMFKESLGFGPFININAKNELSAKLFTDLGWIKQKRSYKMYLFHESVQD